jgi:hypothetical protein
VSGTSDTSAATHLAFLALSPTLGVVGAAVRRRGARRAAEREPLSPAPRVVRWTVLALDYLMITASIFGAILYFTLGMVTPSGAPPYDTPTVVLLVGYGLVLFGLYAAAAHALRTGHPYRWRAHAVALGLTLLPILLSR